MYGMSLLHLSFTYYPHKGNRPYIEFLGNGRVSKPEATKPQWEFFILVGKPFRFCLAPKIFGSTYPKGIFNFSRFQNKYNLGFNTVFLFPAAYRVTSMFSAEGEAQVKDISNVFATNGTGVSRSEMRIF